jgi:hypothetical protein
VVGYSQIVEIKFDDVQRNKIDRRMAEIYQQVRPLQIQLWVFSGREWPCSEAKADSDHIET